MLQRTSLSTDLDYEGYHSKYSLDVLLLQLNEPDVDILHTFITLASIGIKEDIGISKAN